MFEHELGVPGSKVLRDMVLHGNTHLLLPLLDLRSVFESGFFQSFDITLNDVLASLSGVNDESLLMTKWHFSFALPWVCKESRSSQKLAVSEPITIPVTSGVILAGQYKPEDEAIFSRCIHLMYSQTSFTREEKENFKVLRAPDFCL